MKITYMAEIATPKYATPIVPPTGALSKMSSANNGEQVTDMANRIVADSGTMKGQMATEEKAKWYPSEFNETVHLHMTVHAVDALFGNQSVRLVTMCTPLKRGAIFEGFDSYGRAATSHH